MMVYLSECKFGDKLKTRDGRMALFLGECLGVARCFTCVIEDKKHGYFPMLYRKDGKMSYSFIDEDYDIIGKWEDEIEKPATPLRNKARYAESDKAHKGCKRGNGGTMVARHQTSKMS